jgi:hypothetical protein
MKCLIKKMDILRIFKSMEKTKLEIRLLAMDYKWTETEEKNFYDIYVVGDLDKLSDIRLIASGDGEMWDLELPFELAETLIENNKKYGLFFLQLRDKRVFPRSFVIKGLGGGEEFYDNNEGRNYVVKKGRGGNIIPKKKKIILLNSIELYSLFDK